ncbi:MAG: efflux transporter outer membrane subunit [Methyloversatilis sp.]|uniref:efflux transporter outer membrane subunit n=1 Tax=Methyloversatilis sp. TaxID=2569862 RepID=UPI002736943F|nr:efflux transporter outer membrane subunit [Methyloversatilis sp.]MDP3874497.1 efflux transporter outer membrane subunit [Methyloversatilis sp.]
MKPAFRSPALTALAALLLSGCMVGPDYIRPELPLPGRFAVSDDGQPQVAVARGWWKLFNDDTLNALVDRALTDNSDVQRAVARIEQADAVLREVGAALFPDVGVGANASRSRISGVATPIPAGAPLYRNNFQTAISTSFEIDFWGKLRRASEAARAQALGTRYAKDTVELTLVSQLVGSYLNLRALDAQLALSRDTLTTRRDNATILRTRTERGLTNDLELQQALGAVSAIEAQIADLTRSRVIAENQLGLLSGQLDLAIAPGDLRTLPMPPQPPAGLPSSLLDARPDIRQAEADLAAANAQIGVAKAALYPSISLTGNYGAQSRELSDLFSGPANIWSLGIGLDLPLFDAGRRSARVDQASAQQKQALASYVSAVRSAFTDVRDALVAGEQYAQSVVALQAQFDAAARSLELAQKRYDAGYSRYLEVLDAQRSANDASLALVRARQSQLAEVVNLYVALGGGWAGATAEQGEAAAAAP